MIYWQKPALLVHGIMGNGYFYITGCLLWAHTGRAGGAGLCTKPLPCIHSFNPHSSSVRWGLWLSLFSDELGFRELRCFADLPITVSPPRLGVGMWPKSGFWESLRNSSVEPCRELRPPAPMVSGAGHAAPPLMEAASLQQESRGHTQKAAGRRTTCWHRGPLTPAVLLLSYVSCSVLLCLMPFELGFCHLKSPEQ